MRPDEHKAGEGSVDPDENQTINSDEERKEAEINDLVQERNKKSQKNAELDSKLGDASTTDADKMKTDKSKKGKE